jgi:two-component system, chemotaxis family, protein-glutamate methylesterase/glutaminase
MFSHQGPVAGEPALLLYASSADAQDIAMPYHTAHTPPPHEATAPVFPVIVMAASAGGIAALCHIFGALPTDFRAAVAVVQHRSPREPSRLATVLNRCSLLPVQDAAPGDCLQPGRISLAPANRHLLVQPDGSLALSDGAHVRSLRPAADVLFASVAPVCTTRVIAVVLTGWGSDGTHGIQVVKHWGGTVIAQDEASAEAFQMSRSAIATGDVDAVLSLEQIAPALVVQVATLRQTPPTSRGRRATDPT